MAGLTFADACEVVWRELAPTWHVGTFTVMDEGREGEHDYLVVAGARESLVDDDPEYDLLDPPALFVSKATGVLERATLIDSLDRIDAMRPVTRGNDSTVG